MATPAVARLFRGVLSYIDDRLEIPAVFFS